MSGVFTDDESSVKLLELLKPAPVILGTTKAFTEELKCMNADKEVERSDGMPLMDVPYGDNRLLLARAIRCGGRNHN